MAHGVARTADSTNSGGGDGVVRTGHSERKRLPFACPLPL